MRGEPPSTWCCLDLLPDDLVVLLGLSVTRYGGAHDLVRFQRTCKRTHALLSDQFNSFVTAVAHERASSGVWPQTTCNAIKTLEQLAVFEKADHIGMLEENRIGFGFASTEIAQDNGQYDDDDDDEDGILPGRAIICGSRTRLATVARLKAQFPTLRVTLEAHCGTSAPGGIAPRFSRTRGDVVKDALTLLVRNPTYLNSDSDVDDSEESDEDISMTSNDGEDTTESERVYESTASNRLSHSDSSSAEEVDSIADDDGDELDEWIVVNAWGRRISNAATTSSHRYGGIARQGRGWVEIYLNMGELEIPSHPAFYEGFEPYE